MKSLNFSELKLVVDHLNSQTGTQLQDVVTGESEVGLKFHGNGQDLWLWVDLRPLSPAIYCLPRKWSVGAAKQKPLKLFLKAHVAGRRLLRAEFQIQLGRVIQLVFGPEADPATIQFRLFPHGQNVLVTANGKSMAWNKPKDLEELKEIHLPDEDARSVQEMAQQWMGPRPGAGASAEKEKAKKQKLKRLQRAINQLEQELSEDKAEQWRRVGEQLLQNQSLEVDGELQRLIDSSLGFQDNLTRAFDKAKKLKDKRPAQLQRLQNLKDELQQIQDGKVALPVKSSGKSSSLHAQAGSKGRQFQMEDGLVAYRGKSSRDNLVLLRKAKAWYYWVHIKDEPGSHMIIQRNKQQKVTDGQLIKAARWMLNEQFGLRAEDLRGQMFDILVAECRHVRPIKGDKVGRVNYTNERVLRVSI